MSSQLTMLGFGGGQDSTALLYNLHFGAGFRVRCWGSGVDISLFAYELYCHAHSSLRS